MNQFERELIQNAKYRVSDGKLVLIALAAGMVAFALLLSIISGGSVRQAQIFLPEKGKDTVAFRNVEGKVALVGVTGVLGVNPTLTLRTGEFVLEITVINQDTVPHSLRIDRINVTTGLLQPGEQNVISLRSKDPAVFNYYEEGSQVPLGQIRAIKVGFYD